jgi:hypothetical protein
VVSSLPATEETGALGREIVSHQGVGWQLKKSLQCAVQKIVGDITR